MPIVHFFIELTRAFSFDCPALFVTYRVFSPSPHWRLINQSRKQSTSQSTNQCTGSTCISAVIDSQTSSLSINQSVNQFALSHAFECSFEYRSSSGWPMIELTCQSINQYDQASCLGVGAIRLPVPQQLDTSINRSTDQPIIQPSEVVFRSVPIIRPAGSGTDRLRASLGLGYPRFEQSIYSSNDQSTNQSTNRSLVGVSTISTGVVEFKCQSINHFDSLYRNPRINHPLGTITIKGLKTTNQSINQPTNQSVVQNNSLVEAMNALTSDPINQAIIEKVKERQARRDADLTTKAELLNDT